MPKQSKKTSAKTPDSPNRSEETKSPFLVSPTGVGADTCVEIDMVGRGESRPIPQARQIVFTDDRMERGRHKRPLRPRRRRRHTMTAGDRPVQTPACLMTPLKAIRARCLNCTGFEKTAVRECDFTDCPLHGLRMGRRAQATLKTIRAYCLDCCIGQRAEVRLCPATECPLWQYRTGRRPK